MILLIMYCLLSKMSQLRTPHNRASNVVNLTPSGSIFRKVTDLNVLITPETYKRALQKKI